jgi:SAM-dependent methyltransferase
MFTSAEHIAEVRPLLTGRFAAMTDEQLMTVSARLTVRKAVDDEDGDALGRTFAQPRADETAHTVENDAEFADCINDQIGYCLRNAIDYAYCIGEHFNRLDSSVPDYSKVRVLENIPDLSGLSVLELGPGRNFGSMLICQALGAEVAVLDKYLAKWDSSYHPRFYQQLRAAGQQRLPRARWEAIEAIIAAGQHRRKVISQRSCDLATPPSDIPASSFDVIVSNAVLEHVGDTFMTACELARLTRPGGLGVHQVDYRDHRNFDRPYEFLRHDEEEYLQMFLSSRNENGNRVRSHELVEDFRRAGFEIVKMDENLFATPEQLAAARPHMIPRFAAMSDKELLVLSSRIFVRRTDQPVPADVFPKRSGIGSFVKRLVQGD